MWIRLVSKEKHLTRGVSPHGDKAVVGLVSLGPRGLRPPEQGNHRNRSKRPGMENCQVATDVPTGV